MKCNSIVNVYFSETEFTAPLFCERGYITTWINPYNYVELAWRSGCVMDWHRFRWVRCKNRASHPLQGTVNGSTISNTLSTSGAVPYRYKLFRYSLDRYGPACVHTCSGTVPYHLSTLRTGRTNLYRNSLFRNEPYKILEWAMHLLIWTGGAVPFRYRTDPKTLVWTGYKWPRCRWGV